MAIIKKYEMKKMSFEEKNEKIKHLRMEIVKANVTANKSNAKTKEIRRTLARLLTLNKSKGREALKQ